MLKTNVILLICALLVGCSSASVVEKLHKKCEITDTKCLQSLYGSLVHIVINEGIGELGIPKFDPYVLKNLEIPFFGLVKCKVLDGTVNGFKSCKIESIDIDIENKRSKIKIVCQKIVVEGKYKLRPTPLFNELTEGISISGDGKGVCTVENIILNLDFPIVVEKLDDGELHFTFESEETKYTYDISKASIAADNIIVGSQDISALVENIFNKNTKPLLKIVAPSIIDAAMKVILELSEKIHKAYPTKYFISSDMSAFIRTQPF